MNLIFRHFWQSSKLASQKMIWLFLLLNIICKQGTIKKGFISHYVLNWSKICVRCGGCCVGWWLKPIIVFSLAQAEQYWFCLSCQHGNTQDMNIAKYHSRFYNSALPSPGLLQNHAYIINGKPRMPEMLINKQMLLVNHSLWNTLYYPRLDYRHLAAPCTLQRSVAKLIFLGEGKLWIDDSNFASTFSLN